VPSALERRRKPLYDRVFAVPQPPFGLAGLPPQFGQHSAAAGDLVLAESATPRVFNGLDGSYRDFSG